MRRLKKRFACLAALFCTALLVAGNVAAAEWPARPITVLAPFAAGGTVDIVARLVGNKLSKELGQSIIVDNRGGAGGTIATAMLAHAVPDGYTLMVHHQGLAFNASLYTKLSYSPSDIVPVAYIGATPNVLVLAESVPVKNVGEFLAYAKTNRVYYGSGGVGSAGHLPMELMQSMAGLKLEHVPYKGSGPALVDLMSGQIQSMLLTIPAVMPYIKSGKVRPIATSGRTRSPALPNLPTLEEAGIPNFEYAPWYGFFAPAKTPVPVLNRLHEAINKVLADPEVVAKLAQQGLEVHAMTRAEFDDVVVRDISKWGKIIKSLSITVE
ncbi:MAG: Bug family tripartite tricarboxylate transporter substrate binding protein [Burkholderiaceae bacterium]